MKINGPLFSLKASGSVGPRLTFSQRKSGPQARIQKKNTDANTSGQQTERGYFDDGRTAWGTLSAADKAEWKAFNEG